MASQPSLYKWKRQESSPSVFTSRGNVQEWVKQVQKASDDAARDIFVDQPQSLFGRQDVFVDDAAISEAQDLLDSWIQRKKVDDLLVECDFREEKWSHTEQKCVQPGVANSLEQFSLGPDGSIHYDPMDNYYEDIDIETRQPGFDLNEDFDEGYAFQEVVHNMLGKDIVDVGSVNADILHTKTMKFKDPTAKMELRHKQVKEKAKERRAAWEKSHLKKMTKKTVEQEARKQLQREEKEHQNKAKREEEVIRKEMVNIRKALQEENAMRAKQRNREQKEQNVNMLAKREVLKQQKENKDRLKREHAAKEEMKRMLLEKMEEDETRRKQENLKLLQRCFSSWYAIIVNKRIKIGKARALSDWRCKLRAWNGWSTFVWRSRSDRETRALTHEMKEMHRKEALADRFYCQLIFQRCFTAWVAWLRNAQQERKLNEQHHERTSKMATLLKAASSRQLWQKRPEEETNNDIVPCVLAPTDEVEEIFLHPLKREANYENPSQSKRKPVAPNWNNDKHRNAPRQAWPHETLRDMKAQKSTTASTTRRHQVVENANAGIRRERPPHIFRKETVPKLKLPGQHATTGAQAQHEPGHVNDFSSETDVMSDSKTDRNTNVREKLPSSSSTGIKEIEIAGGEDKLLQSSRSGSSCHSKQSIVSTRKPTKPLHLAMEKRAKARAERKQILDKKRREAEEVKLAKLKQEQEQKEMEIMAEKHAILEKKREEKKIAKQRELEKQLRAEEMKKLNRKADDHYHRTLVRKYGLVPWRRLLEAKDEMMSRADKFFENRLLAVCFREWFKLARTECQLRNELADNFFKRILLCRGWRSWRKYRNHLVKMDQIAMEFSKGYLLRKYVKIWQDYVTEERLLYWDKENRADEHNERRLKQTAMAYWKEYIPLLREEVQREKRRADLRKHVQSLLPDFGGMNLSESP